MITKTAGIGFLIGLMFSLVALFTGIQMDAWILVAIPAATAAMSALGTLVSMATSEALARRTRLRTPFCEIAGFLTAALVNTLIVILVLALFGQVRLHPGLLVGLLMGLGTGALYGLYAYRMGRMEDEMAVLRTLHEKQQELQDVQRRLAMTEERNRMSRELHDSVAQGLQGMLLSLGTLRRRLTDPAADTTEILDHLELSARTTLDDLRCLITELSPSLLTEEGLMRSLQIQADLFSARNGIPVQADLRLSGPLPPARELVIYRIAQEALANVEKHAQAASVSLALTGGPQETTTLTIRDDGRGMDPRQNFRGHGLSNMRRRAEEAGAAFRLDTGPLQGTTISIRFGPEE